MKITKAAFFLLLLILLSYEDSYSDELQNNSIDSSGIEKIVVRSTRIPSTTIDTVSYTHLRAHET